VYFFLQAKQLAKKRQKLAHHFEDKNKLLLEGPGSNPTAEYGSSGQAPSTLVMTKHNPMPALYYPPQQVKMPYLHCMVLGFLLMV